MNDNYNISAKNQIKDIQELAEVVAEEYIQYSVGGLGFIDPEYIAREKGIKFSYDNYGQYFDGMLEYHQGRFFIYCNLDRVKERNSTRARFTFAHELGHYFIDEHRLALIRGQSLYYQPNSHLTAKNLLEREANSFASRLLMPNFLFEKILYLTSIPDGLEGILYLKEVFQTSIPSTSIRFIEYNISKCVVFVWDRIDGHLKWHTTSSFFKSLNGKQINNCLSLKKGSPTLNAFNNTEIQRGETVINNFFNIDNNEFKNFQIMEEALLMGEYGIITMIYLPQTESVHPVQYF